MILFLLVCVLCWLLYVLILIEMMNEWIGPMYSHPMESSWDSSHSLTSHHGHLGIAHKCPCKPTASQTMGLAGCNVSFQGHYLTITRCPYKSRLHQSPAKLFYNQFHWTSTRATATVPSPWGFFIERFGLLKAFAETDAWIIPWCRLGPMNSL